MPPPNSSDFCLDFSDTWILMTLSVGIVSGPDMLAEFVKVNQDQSKVNLVKFFILCQVETLKTKMFTLIRR